MEQVEDPVEPAEVVAPLAGLEQRPGEDPDADQVDAGLSHQRDILDPDAFRPLLGVVVAAEGDASSQSRGEITHAATGLSRPAFRTAPRLPIDVQRPASSDGSRTASLSTAHESPVLFARSGNVRRPVRAVPSMTTTVNKKLYTAEATVHGGRDGHGRSSDGALDLDIRAPKEMGGAGGGTNPEQLFALGYAACFQSALAIVARRMGLDASESVVTGRVSIGPVEGGIYGLAVELVIDVPGTDPDSVRQAAEAAHRVCPYSNATRGNIEVTLTIGSA